MHTKSGTFAPLCTIQTYFHPLTISWAHTRTMPSFRPLGERCKSVLQGGDLLQFLAILEGWQTKYSFCCCNLFQDSNSNSLSSSSATHSGFLSLLAIIQLKWVASWWSDSDLPPQGFEPLLLSNCSCCKGFRTVLCMEVLRDAQGFPGFSLCSSYPSSSCCRVDYPRVDYLSR